MALTLQFLLFDQLLISGLSSDALQLLGFLEHFTSDPLNTRQVSAEVEVFPPWQPKRLLLSCISSFSVSQESNALAELWYGFGVRVNVHYEGRTCGGDCIMLVHVGGILSQSVSMECCMKCFLVVSMG